MKMEEMIEHNVIIFQLMCQKLFKAFHLIFKGKLQFLNEET
jgi:hypothetical protein